MRVFFVRTMIMLLFFSGAWESSAAANLKQQVDIIPNYTMQTYAAQIKALYATVPASHSKNIQQRIAADSKVFLGQPYRLGALGEGKQATFDQNPLYRTDAFDCVTYVSTVLALVEANNFKQFKQILPKVRYGNGKPSFLTRNHFVSVDWNLHNARNGYVKDITQKLFPKKYKIATATINKPNWFRHLSASQLKLLHKTSATQTQKLLAQLHALGNKTHVSVSHLPYVPLTALYSKRGKPNKALFKRIPSGTIIEIVRPNWDLKKRIGTNMNISHLGLGIRKKGVLLYREASELQHKVIDIPLAKYLKNYLNSPTVKGIHIEEIRKG